MAALQGIPYTLAGPADTSATVAVLNDPTDSRFVGYLSEPPSGLGAAGVRERGGDRVDVDGGWHGPFLQGRMPFGLSGMIMPADVQAADEARQNRLLLATRALRADGVIYWTEAVRGALCVGYRAQTRTRISGRRPKTFTCALVSADHRVFGQTIHEVVIDTGLSAGDSADFEIPNLGNAPADWHCIVSMAPGAHLTGFSLQLYADAGRTQLISQTELSGIDSTTATYLRAGNPNAPFPGDTGGLRNIAGNDTVYLTDKVDFHPLNWAPAGVPGIGGTVYGTLTIRADSSGFWFNGHLSYRDAWDY
jgi:hypothetical protein